MKESFLLYNNFYEPLKCLTNEQLGRLFKAIFEFNINGIEEVEPDIQIAFVFIKNQINIDSKKYEEQCKKNAENGAKGGRPKKANALKENPTKPNGFENNPEKPNGFLENPTKPKKADNENDNDNDNDNENDNDINNILSSSDETSDESEEEKRKAQEKRRKRAELYKNIIDYLNKKIGSSYKYSTKTTQVKINARLNEGYSLDDFIAVIDKKYDEWKDTEMEQYLCPDTLFGTKFEKYLNQKKVNTKPQNTENLPDWVNKWVNNK